MAYTDQKQGRPVAIGAVVLVHAAIGAGLLSGLAVKFVKEPSKIFEGTNIPVEPPPPPDPTPPEPPVKQALPTTPPIHAPVPVVRAPVETTIPTVATIEPVPFDPAPPVALDPPAPPAPPPSPPPVSLARGAQVRGDQGSWFPQDSYPAAARRAGAQGRVSVSVEVGANGRVVDCRVANSSGNDDLDAATCRLATRNGRFEPARDADGNKVPSRLNLRPVRWTLEQ